MSKLGVETKDGVTVIQFAGPLTADEVVNVEPSFQKAAQIPKGRIVVDLSKVEILATPAITMFIKAMNFQRTSGGRVIFTGTQGSIDKLLHVCRLDMIMTIVPDPQTAIAQAAR